MLSGLLNCQLVTFMHEAGEEPRRLCLLLNTMYMKQKGVVVPKVQTADSCFSLIGPRQYSAALGGLATSNSRPKAPRSLNRQGSSRVLMGFV